MSAREPLAAALMMFGALVAAFGYYIMESAPLMAMGLGTAVTGASVMLTPTHVMPRGFVLRMIEGFSSNFESLLESLGARDKGFVLWKDGKAYVVVPLRGKIEMVPTNLRLGVVISEGAVYIALELPLLGPERGAPLSLEEIFVSELSLCKSISAEHIGDKVIVAIEDPVVPVSVGRMGTITGSMLSLLVAATISARGGTPLRFREERLEGTKLIAIYDVVGEQ